MVTGRKFGVGGEGWGRNRDRGTVATGTGIKLQDRFSSM